MKVDSYEEFQTLYEYYCGEMIVGLLGNLSGFYYHKLKCLFDDNKEYANRLLKES